MYLIVFIYFRLFWLLYFCQVFLLFRFKMFLRFQFHIFCAFFSFRIFYSAVKRGTQDKVIFPYYLCHHRNTRKNGIINGTVHSLAAKWRKLHFCLFSPRKLGLGSKSWPCLQLLRLFFLLPFGQVCSFFCLLFPGHNIYFGVWLLAFVEILNCTWGARWSALL